MYLGNNGYIVGCMDTPRTIKSATYTPSANRTDDAGYVLGDVTYVSFIECDHVLLCNPSMAYKVGSQMNCAKCAKAPTPARAAIASERARDDHSASRRLDVLQAEAPHLIAQPDELRIVVTHETDDGRPELLGTYTRSEEDAVFYVRPGGRENYAPADCCEIVTVTL